MKSKIAIFDTAKVCRDTYKGKFDNLAKKHGFRLKEIKENYMNRLLQEQITAENKRYAEELEKARDEARSFAFEQIDTLRAEEIMKASKLPDQRIHILRSLMNLPMTRAELAALKENLGKDYWTEKAISYLAEKNGIEEEVRPSLDDKLNVLDRLKQALNGYLNGYAGTDTTYTVLRDVSDSQIMEWEKMYTSNYDNVRMSSRQIADRMVTLTLSEPNTATAGLRLKNMVAGMDEWTRTQFFEIFAERGGNTAILSWAGLNNDMKDYLHNTSEPLKKARRIAAEATQYEDKTDTAAFLDNVPEENRKLVSKVLEEIISTTENATLAEGCRLSDVPEFQKLAEPKKL